MLYNEDFVCISEHSRILIKEKDKKYFSYKHVKKVIKLLEENKEIYTFNPKTSANRITSIEFVGIQELMELKSFSGSKIFIGKDTDIFVDTEWITVEEVRFYEKIFEYNFLKECYLGTYITDTQKTEKMKAYKVIAEDPNGIIIDNFIIRFIDRPKTEKDEKDEKEEVKDSFSLDDFVLTK